MPTKVWYEPGREFYVIEFVDDPIFDLPEWAAGQGQGWGAIYYHLLTASVDNKYLYHRLAIELQHRSKEHIRSDLGLHLFEFVRELRHMAEETGRHHPEGHTSRQCLRAAEVLEIEHDNLLERLVAANPGIEMPV